MVSPTLSFSARVKNVVVPFGENGVKADYINLLANAFISDAVNTSYWTVEVNYENEDGRDDL